MTRDRIAFSESKEYIGGMIIEANLNFDKEQQEIFPVEMESFPYRCSQTRLDSRPGRSIPWHWHNIFEIDYVSKGTLLWHTPEDSFVIEKGEAAITNAGVLHTCTAMGDTPCEYYTLQFDMHLLTGMYNSVFEEKYFLPLIRSDVLTSWPVKPDSLLHLKMIEAVLRAVEISREEPFGYEFDIRSVLSSFWRMLLQDTKDLQKAALPGNTADTERIKIMMRYIKEHCAEKLTLDDIAASAGISTRECTRCFRRCINSSPNVYLTHTRLRMAADLLVSSARSVIEISEECGFSSPSYFGKVFREIVGSTPTDYRKKVKEGKAPHIPDSVSLNVTDEEEEEIL